MSRRTRGDIRRQRSRFQSSYYDEDDEEEDEVQQDLEESLTYARWHDLFYNDI